MDFQRIVQMHKQFIADYQNEIEMWLPVNSFPNYMVSSRGRVKNIKTNRFLKPNADTNTVCLSYTKTRSRKRSIDQLVAYEFVPNNTDGLNVEHIDGDISNNSSSNLRYIQKDQLILHF
jgi:hypothetical protein